MAFQGRRTFNRDDGGWASDRRPGEEVEEADEDEENAEEAATWEDGSTVPPHRSPSPLTLNRDASRSS